jgi:hypothetical protein
VVVAVVLHILVQVEQVEQAVEVRLLAQVQQKHHPIQAQH